jgi:predicted metal-dependent phosphoesterase TrpH
MKVDLHTHTTASDGSFTPRQLLDTVCAEGVELWSITDHDTVDAYRELPRFDDIRIVPGIELSAVWLGRTIHVVGLDIDLNSPELEAMVNLQGQARERRAEMIAGRLQRRGLQVDLDDVRRRAGSAGIGRPHFAAALVESGQVRDVRTAFRKFLGAGRPGDLKQLWPPLAEIVTCIRSTGGTPVLAHPDKYKLTRSKLHCLAEDFGAAGGSAIELICGPHDLASRDKLRDLALTFDFSVSMGSDFHAPVPWNRPGVSADLLRGCRPVWETW